jgi:hypothetical protein
MLFFSAWREDILKGREPQESRGSRPGLILRGAKKEAQLFRWEEAPEAHHKGREGFFEKCKRGKGSGETWDATTGQGEKALKGKPQERWKLKETSQDL